MEYERVLSTMLTLVIGVEFIKMLCKHTPETVIDVLLFAMARQIVIYHDNSLDLLLGIIAIVGLFAAKKYLTKKDSHNNNEGFLNNG
jgi:phosphate starvation-inducible membrane PsiE